MPYFQQIKAAIGSISDNSLLSPDYWFRPILLIVNISEMVHEAYFSLADIGVAYLHILGICERIAEVVGVNVLAVISVVITDEIYLIAFIDVAYSLTDSIGLLIYICRLCTCNVTVRIFSVKNEDEVYTLIVEICGNITCYCKFTVFVLDSVCMVISNSVTVYREPVP